MHTRIADALKELSSSLHGLSDTVQELSSGDELTHATSKSLMEIAMDMRDQAESLQKLSTGREAAGPRP